MPGTIENADIHSQIKVKTNGLYEALNGTGRCKALGAWSSAAALTLPLAQPQPLLPHPLPPEACLRLW